MTITALFPAPKVQFSDSTGTPLSGGKVYFYEPGTVTPKDTYSDYDGLVANANPVILDSRGEAVIRLNGRYDVIVKDSGDSTIYTYDDVIASLDSLNVTHTSGGAAGTVSAKFDNIDSVYINAADEDVLPSNSSAVNTAALNALRTKMLADSSRHWIIYFQKGEYAAEHGRWMWGIDKLTVIGYGASFRNSEANNEPYDVDSIPCVSNQSLFRDYAYGTFSDVKEDGYLIDTSTPGALTVTCSTASEAGNFSAGDKAVVYGFDQQFTGMPPNARYFEYRTVVSADSGTGIVTLDKVLRNKYRSDWYEYASATLPIGPGRIINASRTNSSQTSYLEIQGVEFIEEPTWSDAANGALWVQNCRKVVLKDVVCPYLSISQVETTELHRCTIEYFEPDKICDSVYVIDCDIGTATEGTGVNRITINGGRFRDAFSLAPRNLIIDGSPHFETNTNDIMLKVTNGWLTRSCEIRSGVFYPRSNTIGLIGGNQRGSFTVASSVDANTITVTADASARTALAILDMGSVIYTAPTSSGPPKRGIISEIYESGGVIYIDADFDSTPTAAETWYVDTIQNLYIGNLEQVGPYTGVPVTGSGTAGYELNGTNRIECAAANKGGRKQVHVLEFAKRYDAAIEYVAINGYVRRVSVFVDEPYTGADTFANVKVHAQIPSGKVFATVDLKTQGFRECRESETVGKESGDTLNSCGMSWVDEMFIRFDGSGGGGGAGSLANTDDRDLPIVHIEIEYMTMA